MDDLRVGELIELVGEITAIPADAAANNRVYQVAFEGAPVWLFREFVSTGRRVARRAGEHEGQELLQRHHKGHRRTRLLGLSGPAAIVAVHHSGARNSSTF